jgi:predicted O-methyltransferase YrrM
MATLEELFDKGTGGRCHKWRHYFEIYERFLHKFKDSSCSYLEIGVKQGGSLMIMQDYLGKEASITGIDIDPACAALAEEGLDVHIGDQSDAVFLAEIVRQRGPFDIIVDDGSHIADHQLTSFFNLFPALKEGGVYIVEDLHTVFWTGEYQSSRYGINFYDFARGLVEKLSLNFADIRLFERYHQPREERPGAMVMNNFALNEIFGIYFFDSMIVFEKRRRTEPLAEIR